MPLLRGPARELGRAAGREPAALRHEHRHRRGRLKGRRGADRGGRDEPAGEGRRGGGLPRQPQAHGRLAGFKVMFI